MCSYIHIRLSDSNFMEEWKIWLIAACLSVRLSKLQLIDMNMKLCVFLSDSQNQNSWQNEDKICVFCPVYEDLNSW